MMKDKVKIESKNNKRKNPASVCSQDKIIIVMWFLHCMAFRKGNSATSFKESFWGTADGLL